MDENTVVTLILKVLAVLVLVALNGFFVAAEFALVKIRDTQLDPLIHQGHRQARIVREIIGNLNAYLSAAQLGITLASLALGWIGEPVFLALLAPVMSWLQIDSAQARESIAFAVGFTAITFLHIAAGEQAPKALAIQKPLVTSLWIALPLNWFYHASYPLIWILNHSSLWLLRLAGLESVSETEHLHSEDELRLIFTAANRQAGGSRLGRDLVLNALDLRHRIVRHVMRPRQEIIGLNTRASMTDCLEIAEKSRFSRFPLCENGDIDKTLGVVHLKDLYAMRLKARSGADLTAVMRPIIYVPPVARLERLLQFFLDRKLHFAVVVDEYGGTVGMVTLENVLEELVGQIQDEFDQEQPLLKVLGAGVWELSGSLPLHELAELVGEPIEEEGITTTSGLVTQRLGSFPKVGEVLTLGGFQLRVEEMDGLRIARLQLTRTAASSGPEGPDPAANP